MCKEVGDGVFGAFPVLWYAAFHAPHCVAQKWFYRGVWDVHVSARFRLDSIHGNSVMFIFLHLNHREVVEPNINAENDITQSFAGCLLGRYDRC